jgi:hypothetical protein
MLDQSPNDTPMGEAAAEKKYADDGDILPGLKSEAS